MKKYVLGFCFSPDGRAVVLIKKQKPAWQAGRFNGVGGKVEHGESYRAAMAREFAEETGVYISAKDWDEFAVLKGPNWVVYCYRIWSPKAFDARTQEAEEVFLWPSRALPPSALSNLDWLIPYALDHDRPGAPKSRIEVIYGEDHPDNKTKRD